MSDLESKWREEFYILATKDKIDLPDYEFAEKYFLAAKISSYEREIKLFDYQTRADFTETEEMCMSQMREIEQLNGMLKENVNNANKLNGDYRKIQGRITELEKQNEIYRTISMKLVQKEHEIEKRDQLIAQAKPWIENHKRFLGEGFFFNEEFDEWIKQAEELKGEK